MMGAPEFMKKVSKPEFGKKVDRHCPYDEATLRAALQHPGHDICPCCHTVFQAPKEQAAHD